jgi:hypothetical protein
VLPGDRPPAGPSPPPPTGAAHLRWPSAARRAASALPAATSLIHPRPVRRARAPAPLPPVHPLDACPLTPTDRGPRRRARPRRRRRRRRPGRPRRRPLAARGAGLAGRRHAGAAGAGRRRHGQHRRHRSAAARGACRRHRHRTGRPAARHRLRRRGRRRPRSDTGPTTRRPGSGCCTTTPPPPRLPGALREHGAASPSAALLGPKALDWSDPRLLVEVGVTTDRAGHRETGLERRERDQGQHDAPRDVLAVGTAAALVRREVWDAVGGLAPELPLYRDELDLGWRVTASGSRVVVVPQAVVRHARAATTGVRTPGRRRALRWWSTGGTPCWCCSPTRARCGWPSRCPRCCSCRCCACWGTCSPGPWPAHGRGARPAAGARPPRPAAADAPPARRPAHHPARRGAAAAGLPLRAAAGRAEASAALLAGQGVGTAGDVGDPLGATTSRSPSPPSGARACCARSCSARPWRWCCCWPCWRCWPSAPS